MKMSGHNMHQSWASRTAITAMTCPSLKPKIDACYAHSSSIGVLLNQDKLAQKIDTWEQEISYIPTRRKADIVVRNIAASDSSSAPWSGKDEKRRRSRDGSSRSTSQTRDTEDRRRKTPSMDRSRSSRDNSQSSRSNDTGARRYAVPRRRSQSYDRSPSNQGRDTSSSPMDWSSQPQQSQHDSNYGRSRRDQHHYPDRSTPYSRYRSPSWARRQTQGFRKGFIRKDGKIFDSDYDGPGKDGYFPVWRSRSGNRFAVRSDEWGRNVKSQEDQEQQKIFFNSSGAKTHYVKILYGTYDKKEANRPPCQRYDRSRSASGYNSDGPTYSRPSSPATNHPN